MVGVHHFHLAKLREAMLDISEDKQRTRSKPRDRSKKQPGNVIAYHSAQIQVALNGLGQSHITVSDKIENVKAGFFEQGITFGEGVYMLNSELSVMLAAREFKHNGTPLHFLLVPPVRGAFVIDRDKKAAGATLFYVADGDTIKPVRPDRPVILDAMSLLHADSPDELPEISQWHLPSPSLMQLSRDKDATIKALSESGIHVPKGTIVRRGEDFRTYLRSIDFGQEVVIKPNASGTGTGVRFAKVSDEKAIERHVAELHGAGYDVRLEQRLIPIRLNGKNGEPVDWNVRALVTIGENPLFIDGEARFRTQSNKDERPVNISRGAHAITLEELVFDKAIDITAIIATSVEAARALSKHGRAGNYAGLDLIMTEDGAHVLEANMGNVGGIGTITKLRGELPPRIKTILLPELAKAIQRNRPGNVSWEDLPFTSGQWHIDGQVSKFNGQKYGAAYSFKRAIALAPDKEEAHIGLGHAWVKLGKYGHALDSFGQALRLDTDHTHLVYEIADTLVRQQGLRKALSEIRNYKADDPDATWPMMLEGILLEAIPKRRQALRVYEKILAINPADINAAYSRAEIISKLDPKKGIEAWKSVLETDPDNTHVMHRVKLAAEAVGDLETALAMEYRSLSVENTADTHFYISRCLMRKKDYEGAVKHAKEGVKLALDYEHGWNVLAVALHHAGEHEASEKALEQLLSLVGQKNRSRNYKRFLWMAYSQMGRYEEALEAAELEENPDMFSLARLAIRVKNYGRAWEAWRGYKDELGELSKKIKLGQHPEIWWLHNRIIWAENAGESHGIDAIVRLVAGGKAPGYLYGLGQQAYMAVHDKAKARIRRTWQSLQWDLHLRAAPGKQYL